MGTGGSPLVCKRLSSHNMILILSVLLIFPISLGSSSEVQDSHITASYDNVNHSQSEVPSSDSSHQNKKLVEVKHFYLWTRTSANRTSPESLDPSVPGSIKNSSFAARRTFIIIHGFLGWGTEEWVLSLMEKLLKLFNCNVISVDWYAGRNVVEYYTVVARVPYVAQDTALLFKTLNAEKGLSMEDVHAIGHSLGAHISGLSSKKLPTRYKRISGLDPAGLEYRSVPLSQRLAYTDADYVDVMHTNGCYNFWNPWLDCYGIDENIGDADFWPNGGEHQPACTGVANVDGELGCSHMMAYRYFVESIDYSIDDTLFLSRNCSSWKTYASGNCSCGDEAQYMGMHVNTRVSGTFYLKTNISFPYAERDAVCSPGITVDSNVVTIAASAGSSIFIFMIIILSVVLIRRRKSRAVNSGLLIEENDDIDGDDEIIDDQLAADDNELIHDSVATVDDELIADHSTVDESQPSELTLPQDVPAMVV